MERESIRVTRSVLLPSLGDHAAGLALEWPRRSARPEVVHAGRGTVRGRGVHGADRHAEAACRRASRAGAARGRAGRAEPVSESRARSRAARRRSSGRRSPFRGAGLRPARARQRRSVDATASSAGRGRRRSGGRRPRNRLAAVDVLRLASLLPELPRERTRLLDNLGRVRREVGPITMELSDAVADHMNIRRGEVHEVVSFYSFLQVPTDAVRVCTGPVCDCFGARELLESTPGAIEVACLGHCDLAPAMTRGDEIVPTVTHSTNEGPAVGLGTRDTTLADYEARGGLSLLREVPSLERIVEELKTSGLTGYGGAGFPTGMKWEAVSREAGPRYVVVNADEGEPGTIKDRYVMELRPHLMLEATVLAMRVLDATGGLHLSPRGVRHGSRERLLQGDRRVSRRGPARRTVARARRRRRRVHRGRGDRDARVDGGPASDAAAQASVPEPGRVPRTPDTDPERRDAGAHPGHPPERRRVVGRARNARGEGNAPLVGHGRGREARLLRGAERRDDARAGRGVRGRIHGRGRRGRPRRRRERDPSAGRARRAAHPGWPA